jgi:hypothetical protein
LRGVLAATRRLMGAMLLAFLVFFLQFAATTFILILDINESSVFHVTSAVAYCAVFALFILGFAAMLWNLQCDICAKVLREGWLATVKSCFLGSGLSAGQYAWQHCDELAGYLSARPYRLGVFLLPYVLLLAWIVLVLVMPPEWPFA